MDCPPPALYFYVREDKEEHMNHENQLIERGAETPLTVAEIQAQVNTIHQVLTKVMKKGEHFDTIPGTNKPSLLKSGAEKIALTFRFSPTFDVTSKDLGDHQREYAVSCTLRVRGSEVQVGEGVGCCTTLEAKYRFRSDNTGMPVPREYWDTRDVDLIGGSSFHAKKIKGSWFIFKRVEHDNPADYWNTCLKMAKKRALVDAVLTCTAASDLFTQDVEETPQDAPLEAPAVLEKPRTRAPREVSPEEGMTTPMEEEKPRTRGKRTISEKQQKLLYAKSKNSPRGVDGLKAHLKEVYGWESLKDVTMDCMDVVLAFLETPVEEVAGEQTTML